MEELLSGLFVLLWLGSGIAGMVMIVAKGYIFNLTWGIGCVLFILLGWWAIPLMLLLGPLWLGAGLMLQAKQSCPYCRNRISGNASRCQYCHANIHQPRLSSHG